MYRNLTVLVLVILLAGCSTVPRRVAPDLAPALPDPVLEREIVSLEEPVLPVEEPQSVIDPTGLAFGKTVFSGLLRKAYVRLTIVSRQDPDRSHFFTVGDKNNQSVVPWERGRVIEPGYFYLELPPGMYQVTAIAIPVGSTIAEEPVALDFEIALDRVTYLGTLEVNGTKERVRFGGLPVVRPGFEYEIAVRDEFDEARGDFGGLLPEHTAPLVKKLWQMQSAGQFEQKE